MKKVYLAGNPNMYANNWKDHFQNIAGFEFFDPEIHSDQTSPDTFFPDDLNAVNNADIMVANPGTGPAEASWIEVGYFLAKNTTNPGDTCKNLIIIWLKEREPKWSIKFVEKAGYVVETVEEALAKLQELR